MKPVWYKFGAAVETMNASIDGVNYKEVRY